MLVITRALLDTRERCAIRYCALYMAAARGAMRHACYAAATLLYAFYCYAEMCEAEYAMAISAYMRRLPATPLLL